jgi:hypothetical protein
MAEVSHDLDLFDQALFPLLLAVGGFLGKGLDGVVLAAL